MLRAIVIGGGATGSGILRDLAMRGIAAALVEQGDLVNGTSGRYHGLLHSGARYVVKDPESARECMVENPILCRIAPWAVEPCGGLHLRLRHDRADYVPTWLAGCAAAGIPTEPVDLADLRREEPGVSPDVVEAYRTPDGAVDAFRLIPGNVAGAAALGAQVLTYRRVAGLLMSRNGVVGVRMYNLLTGMQEYLEAEVVINAAGAWAGQVTAMAGIQLDMVADRGALVVYHGRLSSQVLLRLRPPDNADAFVPTGSVTILGTTAVPVRGPEDLRIPPGDVDELLRTGAELVPAAATARVLRAFAGVRPLFRVPGAGGHTRDLPRTFQVVDHEAVHGVPGLISVLGGKLTTYRLMAEQAVDMAARKLGVTAPCRTADEPILPPPDPAELRRVTARAGPARAARIAARHPANLGAVAAELARPGGAEVICECEDVTAGELLAVARTLPHLTLSDVRRRTRLGMGTCQGAFCAYRAALALARDGLVEPAAAAGLMLEFLHERWGGVASALPGPELRGAEVTYALYAGLAPDAVAPVLPPAAASIPAAGGESDG